jgi:hypothetical protein
MRLLTASVACLFLVSYPVLPQKVADPNSTEAQRRVFAVSLVISLANEAKSYNDLAIRTRVLARAADTLWDADNITARNLFTRAWEAAEAGDADEVTIKTKDNPPEMVLALRRMSGHDLRVEVLSLVSRRDKALGEQLFAKLKTQNTGEAKSADTRANVFSGPEADTKRMLVAYKLLADDQVAAARDFAAPALTQVNSQSINFLSLLRTKMPRRRIRYLVIFSRASRQIRVRMQIRSLHCRLTLSRQAFTSSSGPTETPPGHNRKSQSFLQTCPRLCVPGFSRLQPACSCVLCHRQMKTRVRPDAKAG